MLPVRKVRIAAYRLTRHATSRVPRFRPQGPFMDAWHHGPPVLIIPASPSSLHTLLVVRFQLASGPHPKVPAIQGETALELIEHVATTHNTEKWKSDASEARRRWRSRSAVERGVVRRTMVTVQLATRRGPLPDRGGVGSGRISKNLSSTLFRKRGAPLYL
jgi:hypothetical protein